MVKIDGTRFGYITIDEKERQWDVIIIGEEVSPREYERLKREFGTGHRIADWEIEQLLSNGPEAIVIGTGQSGALSVSDEVKRKIESAGAEVISAKTPEAIEKYNELKEKGKKVNALMHATC